MKKRQHVRAHVQYMIHVNDFGNDHDYKLSTCLHRYNINHIAPKRYIFESVNQAENVSHMKYMLVCELLVSI